LYVIYFLIASSGAGAINLSHELIHKEDPFERLVGILNLGKVFYQHWWIEHVYGHHRRVGTDKDPATARLGQSLYQFIPQTVIGTWKSSWDLEKNRLLKKYGSVWVMQNQFIYFILFYLTLPAVIWQGIGLRAAIYCIIFGFSGALFLEIVNYLEHYGLEREEGEPVTIHHSWNAPHRFTNYGLFKLQRHSDHHENGYKPYQILATYEEAPTLPHGYPTLIIMTLFPPIWKRVMDPLALDALKKVQLTKEQKAKVLREVNLFTGLVFVVLTAIFIAKLCWSFMPTPLYAA
jgi:alkane 1-monooxygenase